MITEESIIDIVDAKIIGDHCLEISFSDGMMQKVDFGPFLAHSLHPEIRKYLDPRHFSGFTIESGDLIWGDYDLCFPIADLYDGKI